MRRVEDVQVGVVPRGGLMRRLLRPRIIIPSLSRAERLAVSLRLGLGRYFDCTRCGLIIFSKFDSFGAIFTLLHLNLVVFLDERLGR